MAHSHRLRLPCPFLWVTDVIPTSARSLACESSGPLVVRPPPGVLSSLPEGVYASPLPPSHVTSLCPFRLANVRIVSLAPLASASKSLLAFPPPRPPACTVPQSPTPSAFMHLTEGIDTAVSAKEIIVHNEVCSFDSLERGALCFHKPPSSALPPR